MNFQESYQKAKSYGYSDEEIISHLEKKDPEFSKKISKAKEHGYSEKEIYTFLSGSEETNQTQKEQSTLEGVGNIGKQYAQGLGIGALGTYGDILSLLGGDTSQQLPGEKAKREREFDILEKMRAGERPSTQDLIDLSEDEYHYGRLPTSQSLEKAGGKMGLVSEPKTAAQRYAKRIGKIQGSFMSTGSTNLAAPIAAGVAGQTVEEAGGAPWLQAAAEIIASLKYSPKSNTAVTSKSPEVKKTIEKLREAGFTEQDITLAKNALEERKILKKFARLTPEAENTIQSSIKNSEKLLHEEIKKGLPGYAEGGLNYLEKQASNVYNSMEEVASSVAIKNPKPVQNAIKNSINHLEKYPLLKDQKEFIEFLKDGLEKSANANTAEFYTGFYRNLNKAGNWSNPKQKEHILGMIKKGIKETFEESGPEAKKFGEYFEKTNESWKRWLDTKDLMQDLEKAVGMDGIDFGKVQKVLNDPDMHNIANKVLGPQQTKNIKSISEGAQHIESFLKQIPKSNKDISEIKYLTAISSLLSKNMKPLATLVGYDVAKKIATNILTNPKKQNTMLRLIDATKNNSLKTAILLSQELLKD